MNFLRRVLRPFARLVRALFPHQEKPYAYQPSHHIIADYAEFAGLTLDEVVNRINSYKALTKQEWEHLPEGDFGERAKVFYERSRYYICDILAANHSTQELVNKLNGYTPLILDSIRNTPGKRLIEFGGGTGVFCEIAARMGKDVTYLDIPGQPAEFAAWRFARHELPVRIQLTTPGVLELQENYDVVFTDAVLEHLDDPYTPTRTLADHLNPGGTFVMLVDLSGEEEDMPMHKDVDVVRLHAVLEESGLVNTYGRHTFASLWTRPAT